jgi:hypothetical protein
MGRMPRRLCGTEWDDRHWGRDEWEGSAVCGSDGDGSAEYLDVDFAASAVNAWLNGC